MPYYSVLRNALNAIVNAERSGKRQVLLRPVSKVVVKFLLVMQKHGYIGDFELIDDKRNNKIVVELLGRLNKAGVVSPRFDVKLPSLERWTQNLLPSRQYGFIVLTTSFGIMDHEEARRKHTGAHTKLVDIFPMDSSVKETLNTIIGSLGVAFGFLCFNTNEAIVKWSKLPVSELLFGRYCVQLIIACIWWNLKRPKGTYVNNWYGDNPFILNIWSRGVFYGMHVTVLWFAMKRLPVGDGNAILTQNALITALFGRLLFKESLPKLFPIVAIFAIIGSFFISQPLFMLSFIYKDENVNDHQPLNIDGLIAIIIGIISWSICCVLIRSAKESHFLQLEIVSASLMVFIMTPIFVLFNTYCLGISEIGTFNNIQFDINSFIIMLITGIIGFSGLSACVIGYQLGDATKVSILEYMTIIYSCLYQTFLFNDALNVFEAFGISLVIIACIINLGEQYYDYQKAKRMQQINDDSESDEEENLNLRDSEREINPLLEQNEFINENDHKVIV